MKIGDAEIPTEADGSVRIRFAGDQPGRRFPAWRLLAGDVRFRFVIDNSTLAKA